MAEVHWTEQSGAWVTVAGIRDTDIYLLRDMLDPTRWKLERIAPGTPPVFQSLLTDALHVFRTPWCVAPWRSRPAQARRVAEAWLAAHNRAPYGDKEGV